MNVLKSYLRNIDQVESVKYRIDIMPTDVYLFYKIDYPLHKLTYHYYVSSEFILRTHHDGDKLYSIMVISH